MKRTREDEPSKARRGWKRGRPAQNGDGAPPAAKPKRSSRSVFGPSGEDRPDVLTDAETVVLPIWLHRRPSADGKSGTSAASFLKTISVPAQQDGTTRPAPGAGAGAGAGPGPGPGPGKRRKPRLRQKPRPRRRPASRRRRRGRRRRPGPGLSQYLATWTPGQRRETRGWATRPTLTRVKPVQLTLSPVKPGRRMRGQAKPPKPGRLRLTPSRSFGPRRQPGLAPATAP